MKILFVDDDKMVREAMANLLKMKGHNVLTARDGYDALAILSMRSRFDLIITDLNMPLINGYQLAEGAEAISSAPVILHTGDPWAKVKVNIKTVVVKGDLRTLFRWISYYGKIQVNEKELDS